jgi:uncharacterized membrane protein
MWATLRASWESLRASLWFVPTVMTVGTLLLAWATLNVDVEEHGLWWLNRGNWDSVTQFLSSLLGALITMATLVISITMVVLTLAAGQLGPRLIRSFMRDLHTQGVVGLFVATVVYLLVVLSQLDTDVPKEELPHVAVTVGTALVLLCVWSLLGYVHHLARSIIADTVIDRVGRELDRAISAHTPERGAAEPDTVDHRPGTTAILRFRQSGYVAAIDYEGLAKRAARSQATIALRFRPGQHLLRGRAHADVWPAERCDDALRDDVEGYVVVGRQRTATQDLEYGFRQLVEVALRALSPGINDPFTAVIAIDRMAASLAVLIERGPPRAVWRDEGGQVRLVAQTTSFPELVQTAFDPIRLAAEEHPAVLVRILENVAQLAEQADPSQHGPVLKEQARLVLDAGRRSIAASYDLAALERSYAAAEAILGGS